MKKKTVVAVICIAAAASVLLAVLAVVGYLLPYLSAQTAMPENGTEIVYTRGQTQLILITQDGSVISIEYRMAG